VAQLSLKVYPGFEGPKSGEDIDAYVKRHSRLIDELTQESNALPEGVIVGGVIKFQVADGYAMYLVVKDKPLTLQHLPFGDGYCVNPAMIRGLRRVDIVEMLTRERSWAKLFSNRAKKTASDA
jgi:hypothetical protein